MLDGGSGLRVKNRPEEAEKELGKRKNCPMETARVWSSGGNNWGRSRELHVDRAVPVDEIHRSVWKEDRSAMNPTGDDVGILSKRIDELTATVNRLSRLFSEYVYPEGSKRGGRTLSVS